MDSTDSTYSTNSTNSTYSTDSTSPVNNVEYYIYVNAFWYGFENKTDANTIDIFEKIFSKTLLRNFKITNDLNIANVLFESVFGNTLANIKNWKYKIFYSGEPYISNPEKYDVLLYSSETRGNVVDLPLYAVYIQNNNFMERLMYRPVITKIPEKFCCFIVSNDACKTRNNMFNILNKYKKVDSGGKYCNNINYVIKDNYWCDEFRAFISNYKFIICFENHRLGTYSTEKIVNPYIAGSIPIYWSSKHIHKVFSRNSMLFLEEDNVDSFQKLINEIIELDNDDAKYLEFINRPIFNDKDMKYYNDNYTVDAVAVKIDNVLLKK